MILALARSGALMIPHAEVRDGLHAEALACAGLRRAMARKMAQATLADLLRRLGSGHSLRWAQGDGQPNPSGRTSRMKRIVLAALIGLIALGSVSAPALRAGQPVDSEDADDGLDADSFAASVGITLEEAQRRLEERRELDPAIEFVASNRSAFGGVFFDQDAGGVLDIAVASNDDEMRAALSKLLPSGASVRWQAPST